jgi:hypothetical protein
MGKTCKQIWFKHTNGALKRIPGIVNNLDLGPKMVQETETVHDWKGTRKRTVLRWDKDHIVKLTLLNEELEAKLTAKDKTYSEDVQNKIQARRAEQADAVIQANEALRDVIRNYERSGGIQVVEWDKVVDVDSLDAREAVISELSPIAIADFENRGIEIPAHLKRQAPTAKADTGGVVIKDSIKKTKE